MAQSKGALSVGVRLHDLPEGTVEERIRMAGKLGFSCIQLPSKVLYKSFGINRSGLTHELADHLREVLDTNGVQVAVLGCYKNLATPDQNQLVDTYAEYEACLRFARWLGAVRWGPRRGAPTPRTRWPMTVFRPLRSMRFAKDSHACARWPKRRAASF